MITREQALWALDNMDDYARMAGVIALGPMNVLRQYIWQSAPVAEQATKEAAEDAPKLWLWQNFVNGRPEYWAFDNPYPINLDNGDPQTLGEPCGYAIFKPSRQGRFDKSEEQVLAAIRAAMAQERTA